MNWTLDFTPFLSWQITSALAVPLGLLALLFLFHRPRGWGLRLSALLCAYLALLNPGLIEEEREPLSSVTAIIVDRSSSQKLASREDETSTALQEIKRHLAEIPNMETRIIETNGHNIAGEGTALFHDLKRNLSNIPPDRIAGAILLSDGQVHDIPETIEDLGFNAPIHALITGKENEYDQRIVLTQAPRFGIVGEEKEIKFKVETTDSQSQKTAEIIIALNGEELITQTVPVGENITLSIGIDRGGKNILEIRVKEKKGELTNLNNVAVQTIEGIRENLRVLLVSGEPHPGERTWRNLLKSDASVDLVHFTILRPPEKQDGTPINQLSLIAFPTRELFSVKINEFDLIIFDRYQQRGVLPILYFDNIARYVEDGGAVLIAAGPDYAAPISLYQTPLASVLPGIPTGEVIEKPFHAEITEEGARHPVTRDLKGADATPPNWSRWFRLVDVAHTEGNVIMSGADKKPLLVLNREKEGRVALMLSDHAWLWARGFEGGGPHVQLLRRLSHWLMKEPDLEEEALHGFSKNDTLIIQRQTMQDVFKEGKKPEVEITHPSGEQKNIILQNKTTGLYEGRITSPEAGLYKITHDTLKTLVHVGPANPKEFQDVVSTPQKLEKITNKTKGSVKRLSKGIPNFIPLKNNPRSFSGRNWLGLKKTEASLLKGINRFSLLSGFLGLGILLGLLSLMWYREGR